MKILGWILLLATTHAFAQEAIESIPLSVEDDGTRKIIEGNNNSAVKPAAPKEIIKVEAVEVKPESLEEVEEITKQNNPKKAKTKKEKVSQREESLPHVVVAPEASPIDGQLKLEENSKETAKEAPVAATPAAPIEEPIVIQNLPVTMAEDDIIALAFSERAALMKYIQFSHGYMDSQYKKINPNLSNGSMLTTFRFTADISRQFQSGFGIEVVVDKSGRSVPDSIRTLQYRLFVDYHTPLFKGATMFDWVFGLSLSGGDYSLKRYYINAAGEEVAVKIKEGTLIGLIPGAGLRIYLVGKNSFDIMLEYHQYFGKPQSYIGGLAITPRLNFEF